MDRVRFQRPLFHHERNITTLFSQISWKTVQKVLTSNPSPTIEFLKTFFEKEYLAQRRRRRRRRRLNGKEVSDSEFEKQRIWTASRNRFRYNGPRILFHPLEHLVEARLSFERARPLFQPRQSAGHETTIDFHRVCHRVHLTASQFSFILEIYRRPSRPTLDHDHREIISERKRDRRKLISLFV